MSHPFVDIVIPQDLTELQMQALHVWLATIASKLERRRPFARRNQRHHDYVRDQRELLQLRLSLWQDESNLPELRDNIAALRTIIQQKIHHYWHIGVTDGTQLDVQYPITNAVRPYSVDLQAFRPLNWESDHATLLEMRNLFRALGTVPKYRIEVTGFLESIEDHLLAGYMASELAREYEAYARVRLHPLFHTARGERAWTLDDSRALAYQLGGTTHEISYNSARDGSEQVYYLLDSDAMRAWTQDDRFYLHG